MALRIGKVSIDRNAISFVSLFYFFLLENDCQHWQWFRVFHSTNTFTPLKMINLNVSVSEILDLFFLFWSQSLSPLPLQQLIWWQQSNTLRDTKYWETFEMKNKFMTDFQLIYYKTSSINLLNRNFLFFCGCFDIKKTMGVSWVFRQREIFEI